jgi:hypothetical protein
VAVLPLVDLMPDEERVHNASSFFRFAPRNGVDSLREMVEGPDAWLAACSLFLIGEIRLEPLAQLAHLSVESPERVVQDTALWTRSRFLPS